MKETLPASFPRATQIKRAIAAVVNAGVAIGSVEISPTGVIRVIAAGTSTGNVANDFDEWDRKGAL
tara:strand:+ start:1989 stop:2186 length:198 start_codon:yes stop_codon:yes gene_type:complete